MAKGSCSCCFLSNVYALYIVFFFQEEVEVSQFHAVVCTARSTEITCIGAGETCGVGEGMKRCPSGAAIALDSTCVTLRHGMVFG